MYEKNKILYSLEEIENEYNIIFTKEEYQVAAKYPVVVSKYYLDLIDWESDYRKDPIWKQVIPDPLEIDSKIQSQLLEDSLSEEYKSPVPHFIHKYKDRGVILTTNKCATYCRFCFRKRCWKSDTKIEDIKSEELAKISEYLKNHPEIGEVLISGGDPLTLSNGKLIEIISVISNIKTIYNIRIASRVPVTMPTIVKEEIIDAQYLHIKILMEYGL